MVKGEEADGVLLSLPDAGSVQRRATADPATDGVLCVGYVAITGGRRLAAIAPPDDETDARPTAAGRQVAGCVV